MKLDPDRPVTNVAKRLRLELLWVKAELERELGKLVLNCTVCDMEVHWVSGVSMADRGHWGHPFQAANGEPVVQRRHGLRRSDVIAKSVPCACRGWWTSERGAIGAESRRGWGP